MLIRLLGPVMITGPAGVVDEKGDLSGAQPRTTLAYLVLHRTVHVPIERLAEVVWSPVPPPTWRPALRTLVARVRKAVTTADPEASLVADPAGYRLHLSEPARVDVEVTRFAMRRAEEALGDGDVEEAVTHAAEAERTVRDPFLARAGGPWVDGVRHDLRDVRIRALHVLGECHLARGDPARASRAAREAIESGPIHEASHRLAMRALAAAGEKGRAAEAYEHCRRTLAERLGVDPSPQTRELLTSILRD